MGSISNCAYEWIKERLLVGNVLADGIKEISGPPGTALQNGRSSFHEQYDEDQSSMPTVTVHIVAEEPADISKAREAVIGITGLVLMEHGRTDAQKFLASENDAVVIYRIPAERTVDDLATLAAQCRLILISDEVENAVRAYDLGAADFLLGSFSVDRLRKAIHRALSLRTMNDGERSNGQGRTRGELHLKSGKSFVRVDVHSIELVQGMGNYTKLHLGDGHVLVNETMVRMMELLPSKHFLRIHRSYIICIHAMRSFGRNTVEWRGRELPIGRSYKQSVLQTLNSIDHSPVD